MYFLNGGIFERWLGLNKAISVRPREPIGLWEEHGRKRPVPAPCPLSCDSLLQNCQQEGHQQMRPLDLGALPGAKTNIPVTHLAWGIMLLARENRQGEHTLMCPEHCSARLCFDFVICGVEMIHSLSEHCCEGSGCQPKSLNALSIGERCRHCHSSQMCRENGQRFMHTNISASTV